MEFIDLVLPSQTSVRTYLEHNPRKLQNYNRYITELQEFENLGEKVHESGNNISQFQNMITELRTAIFLKNKFTSLNMAQGTLRFCTGRGPDILFEIGNLNLYWEVVDAQKANPEGGIAGFLWDCMRTFFSNLDATYEITIKLRADLFFEHPDPTAHFEAERNVIDNQLREFQEQFIDPRELNENVSYRTPNFEVFYQKILDERQDPNNIIFLRSGLSSEMAHIVGDGEIYYWVRKIRNEIHAKTKRVERNQNTLSFIAIIIDEMNCELRYLDRACWGERVTRAGLRDIPTCPRITNLENTRWIPYLRERGIIPNEIYYYRPIGNLDRNGRFLTDIPWDNFPNVLDGYFADEPLEPYTDGVFLIHLGTKQYAFKPNPAVQNQDHIGILTRLELKSDSLPI